MKKNWQLFPLLVIMSMGTAYTQEKPAEEEKKTEFKADAEFRIRSEVLYGYRIPPDSNSKAAFVTSQRSRLNLNFASKWVDARLSLQDVRAWGEYDSRSRTGTFMLYEAWVEIPVKKTGLSFKLGKQEIKYDNDRLLATNNWRQAGRTHEAAALKFYRKNTEFHVLNAYNQKGFNNYGRDYLISAEEYKLLNVIWFKQKLADKWAITSLNVGDGFQADTNVASLKGSTKLLYRVTNFGRVEFDNKKSVYITVAGAVQYGKNNKDQKIFAWYVNPEVKYTGIKNLSLRTGIEVLSGQNGEEPVEKINSFSTLYGSGHRFNGSMDLYTLFPNDVKSGGFINPYLYSHYNFNDKISLGADFHVFSHSNNYVKNSETLNKYLGFESDFLFRYTPHKIIALEAGYSLYKGSETSVAVKGGETDRLGQWAYVQLTVKPEFFKISK